MPLFMQNSNRQVTNGSPTLWNEYFELTAIRLIQPQLSRNLANWIVEMSDTKPTKKNRYRFSILMVNEAYRSHQITPETFRIRISGQQHIFIDNDIVHFLLFLPNEQRLEWLCDPRLVQWNLKERRNKLPIPSRVKHLHWIVGCTCLHVTIPWRISSMWRTHKSTWRRWRWEWRLCKTLTVFRTR